VKYIGGPFDGKLSSTKEPRHGDTVREKLLGYSIDYTCQGEGLLFDQVWVPRALFGGELGRAIKEIKEYLEDQEKPERD